MTLPSSSAAETDSATTSQPLGIALENYNYPYPVAYFPLTIEGEDVRMAYMDVPPPQATGSSETPTVLLLHGKNFFGAYWDSTIRALHAGGFRVVVPDQIGFGKSSKPDIHYSFHALAANTKALLDHLQVKQTAVVGHSMGGMLAARFALMYPDVATRLVLENPIGLEDYRTSVPYTPTEEHYRQALTTTLEQTRKYHQTYYVTWKPEYDEYVQVHDRWTLGGEAPRLARVSALTSQMIYEQPVVHQFPEIRVPTLVVIGQEDRTVIGRGKVTPQVLAQLGQYPELGRATARAIPGARLLELPGVGHIPHFEAPAPFHTALIAFLRRP